MTCIVAVDVEGKLMDLVVYHLIMGNVSPAQTGVENGVEISPGEKVRLL